MITFFEANLLKLALHHVGNPVIDQGYSLSEYPLDVTDETKRQLLMQYFLTPFQKTAEVYQFYHPSGVLGQNYVYEYCKTLFGESAVFQNASECIALALHGASNHPKIKSGELYVVLFENLQIEGELLQAIGIFKSESKETYLKVNPAIGAYDVIYEQQAVNINNLDKGCIVFNTEAEKGFKVAIVDNGSKNDQSYWVDDFLQLQVRKDTYQSTVNIMAICKNFIIEKLADDFEMSNQSKVELLNRTVEYFKQKETFDQDEFAGEVMGNEAAVNSFKIYKEQWEADFDLSIPSTFDIAEAAVKKQCRSFKKVLKLDRNFQLHIDCKDASLIQRGFDETKGMNYYKVYFKEERL